MLTGPRLIVWCAVAGAAVGTVLALPTWASLFEPGTGSRAGRIALVLGLTASCAIAAGLWGWRLTGIGPAQQRYIFRLAAAGLGFGVVIGSAFVTTMVTAWAGGVKNTSLVESAVLGAVFVIAGAVFGAMIGESGAQDAEIVAWGDKRLTLDDRRDRLMSAMEKKFGPLGDAHRFAVRAWDGDRVTDARLRLDDARSLDELP